MLSQQAKWRRAQLHLSTSELRESAMLQFKLENAGYELIFMDEFSMSSRFNKHYTWSKVSEKGYIKIKYDNFSMFLVIPFLQETFMEWIQGSSKAMQ